jgi:hypothetical protein
MTCVNTAFGGLWGGQNAPDSGITVSLLQPPHNAFSRRGLPLKPPPPAPEISHCLRKMFLIVCQLRTE